MNIYINNTRTFKDYFQFYHHHDLMLANGCMAGANADQDKVYVPKIGEVVALYANRFGLVAYGFASDQIVYLDDARVNGTPTKLRKLDNFRMLAHPIKESEYATSNTMTLQKVHEGKAELWSLLKDRTLPEPQIGLFNS